MLWEEILTVSTQTGLTSRQTLQEHLQKAVLAALSRHNAFRHIVFQGGTALRLFYNNPRFSEDLDFVLHPAHTTFDLTELLNMLPGFLTPLYPFLDRITTRLQKQDTTLQRGVLHTTSNNPQQAIRLHIELAMVPSHQHTQKILSFPPLHPAVRIETPTEILADKLLALGCREYIKGRDLWDIYFLCTEHHLIAPWELVWKKTHDYHTTPSTVHQRLKQVQTSLKTQGPPLLSSELTRFLPPTIYTMYQNEFSDIITQITSLLDTAAL